MGFKTDTSFLRFLTMGAVGVRRTMEQLRRLGFEPIELERYCGSNKIWMTKVKRLRLPDLLCVKTGLRVEVRAKTDLRIRMSDAPANPDRVWDAGNRDDDLVAFIACFDRDNGPVPADEAVFFTIKALRDSVHLSRLGPPKSASEGAERDRTWPATVPGRDGTVLQVNADKVVVQMRADGERGERRQTFTLAGKTPYVRPGDSFIGDASIIAGAPSSVADLRPYLENRYDPLEHLSSTSHVDRYAAIKSLPHRPELGERRIAALEDLLRRETEERVALEAAGVAAALGSRLGQERISAFIWDNEERPVLRMEAVLILTELATTFSHGELRKIATAERFAGDEIRQAAVWGLGKAGLRVYDDLLPFIDDPDENVALHAIAGFPADTPPATIERLVQDLVAADPGARRAPAASAALRMIGSERAIDALIRAYKATPSDWIVATLGRMPPDPTRARLRGDPLLERIAPLLLTADGANWLANQKIVTDIAFLLGQNTY